MRSAERHRARRRINNEVVERRYLDAALGTVASFAGHCGGCLRASVCAAMKKLKTFVFGILLAVLFSMPWAFIATGLQLSNFMTGLVAVPLGALGMGIAIWIDAKPPGEPLGE